MLIRNKRQYSFRGLARGDTATGNSLQGELELSSIGSTTSSISVQTLYTVRQAVQYKQFVGRGGWGQARRDQLATPAWLSRLAPEAKAVAFALEELNRFVAPKHGQDNLENVITKLTGNTTCLYAAQCTRS